jgi:predicted DNA-binding ribbon-helix-helix protein
MQRSVKHAPAFFLAQDSGGDGVGPSRLVNRNVTATHGRTSIRLEPELWSALEEMSQRERLSLGAIVKQIEQLGHPGGRTSAVRVRLLTYYREAATDEGHLAAGHGPLPEPLR